MSKESKVNEKVLSSKEEQNSAERKKSLIKLGSLAVFTGIVLIFATVAWFTMGKEANTDGLSFTSVGLPFEIATKGELVRNQQIFASADSDYSEGTQTQLPSPTDTSMVTYYTSENTQSLFLRFTPESNETDNGVEPGGSGVLDMYIVPRESGSLSVELSLKVIGYAEVDAYVFDDSGEKIQLTDQQSGEEFYKTEKKLMCISDITTENCALTSDEIEALNKAEDHLGGHVMFFKGISDEPSKYYYTEPLTERKYTFDNGGEDVQAETAYPVPVYWMWTNTFGQIALKDNLSNLRGTHIPVVKDSDAAEGTDKAKVIQYLKDNKSSIFLDLVNIAALTEEQTSGKTSEEIDALVNSTVDDLIDNADVKKNFDLLCSGYNDADNEIGTNISYFVIEVTAECKD